MSALFLYLLQDTLARWWENLASPLTKIGIATLLSITAAIILQTFFFMAANIEQRLHALGSNRILIQQTINKNQLDQQYLPFAQHLNALCPPHSHYPLRKLFPQATTDFSDRTSIYVYSRQDLQWLAPHIPETLQSQAAFYISHKLTAGIPLQFAIDKQPPQPAVTLPALPWMSGLENQDFLLIPQGSLPSAESLGFTQRSLLLVHTDQPATLAQTIRQLVDTLHTLLRLYPQGQVRIQDPLSILQELDTIKGYQKLWRLILLALFGLLLCLVLSALTILEFRNNRYITALLSSLGAPRSCLGLSHTLENLLLANCGLVLGMALLHFSLHPLYTSLGFSTQLLQSVSFQQFISQEGPWLLLFINMAGLISSLPIWLGLRTPEGRILS